MVIMKSLFSAFILLLFSYTLYGQVYKNYPMWNEQLSNEQRIEDLIRRLTLKEKVYQMLNATPAIDRLGIPAYDWWNEVLHGVARTPYHTTVFPQAIAMAATWDTTMLAQMADYSALEGRAVFNKANKENRKHLRYLGLTYWTPNINIFRDPRWGRGQETYGEDPFLTAMLGRAFVHGLQGDDPKYLKAAACAKHFAVHSGPEPLRHVFDANVSDFDLWNTYLPAFQELITGTNVAGVMCAYNAFRTQPCCGSDLLMNDILRNRWKFKGYVTSDCWAIDDFFKHHKTHPDSAAAAVDAVMHGTDVECGTNVYYTLINAVNEGKITERQIDISLRRLFEVRFKLGLFDSPANVKYAQTPASVIECKEHQELALKMAQQSIVLLKNEKNILPLDKKIKKIAVVGPNADNDISVLGNYNGTPSHVVTALEGIKRKLPHATVLYEKAINFTNDTLLQYQDMSPFFAVDGRRGVKAEYFNNLELAGKPSAVRYEKDFKNSWAEGQRPYPSVNSYNFTARFSTMLTPDKTEKLTFEVSADDAYRVFVNGELKLDAWERNRWGARNFEVHLLKGRKYTIVLEYKQLEGAASVDLSCGKYRKTDFNAMVNRLKDVDAIVYVGGISPQLEGEEMKVPYPGFNGGDRTSIMLPSVQTELLKSLNTIGKPVVFVMMTGSAIATPWESEHIPVIVNAWYGGQSAGTALADVLFGDYNPVGRLPVTFYKSDADLPDFNNYEMKGRTYRYFNGKPLYPFGYGLSYTRFRYDSLSVKGNLAQDSLLNIRVKVSNVGSLKGEEVVQLYVSYEGEELTPLRSLKGFQKIALLSGESKVVTFDIRSSHLSLLDKNGVAYIPNASLSISVGGGQPLDFVKTTSNYLRADIKKN